MPDVSSAAVAGNTPESALDFQTWFSNKYAGTPWANVNIEGWNNPFFQGQYQRQRQEYETYLSNLSLKNEQRALQSAMAFDELMENTATQRAFKDIAAAGANPYLILNSGSLPSYSGGSSAKANYSRSSGVKTGANTSSQMLGLLLQVVGKLIGFSSSASATGQSRKDIYYHWDN